MNVRPLAAARWVDKHNGDSITFHQFPVDPFNMFKAACN